MSGTSRRGVQLPMVGFRPPRSRKSRRTFRKGHLFGEPLLDQPSTNWLGELFQQHHGDQDHQKNRRHMPPWKLLPGIDQLAGDATCSEPSQDLCVPAVAIQNGLQGGQKLGQDLKQHRKTQDLPATRPRGGEGLLRTQRCVSMSSANHFPTRTLVWLRKARINSGITRLRPQTAPATPGNVQSGEYPPTLQSAKGTTSNTNSSVPSRASSIVRILKPNTRIKQPHGSTTN